MPSSRRIYKIKALTTTLAKIRKSKPLLLDSCPTAKYYSKQNTTGLRLSISCPKFANPIKTFFTARSWSVESSRPLVQTRSCSNVPRRSYATCDAKCPCPFPCGPCGCRSGCGCLPPPCNTPPKCLQYMTGYYYYPYGTWFCGPYHVAGTCCPVGANGPPCPCPPKCCAVCMCPAPPSNFKQEKTSYEQFPMEVSQVGSKIPNESTAGIPKYLNFNTSDKKISTPKQEKHLPPVLASMICPSLQISSDLLDKEPRIQSSYPITRSGLNAKSHTAVNTTISKDTPVQHKQKNWRYSYYQKRHKVSTPLQRDSFVLNRERKSINRSYLRSVNYSSTSNQNPRDPRPDVDIEIKPYE